LLLFNSPPHTAIYPLSLHDALPIFRGHVGPRRARAREGQVVDVEVVQAVDDLRPRVAAVAAPEDAVDLDAGPDDSRIVRIDEDRSEEHTSELQSRGHLVCRLLLEKK